MAYYRCIGSSGGGGGTELVSHGTFVTSDTQYGIVNINCGFEPDAVIVTLSFGNDDTTSYWYRDASWGDQYACWNLYPAEGTVYFIELGRVYGETGIQNINSNGFSFMSNAWNTLGVTCEYVAVKYQPNNHIDIFNRASTITPSGSNGVSKIYSKVESNTGIISCIEYQAGYEGMNIALNNLEVGHTYTVNFDLAFVECAYWDAPTYRCGYAVLDTNDTYYENWENGPWSENLTRDSSEHHYSSTFTATSTTMYLSFNLCGLSDYQTNSFYINNIYVDEVV